MIEQLGHVRASSQQRDGFTTYVRGRSDDLDVAVLRHRHHTVHLRATNRNHPMLVDR